MINLIINTNLGLNLKYLRLAMSPRQSVYQIMHTTTRERNQYLQKIRSSSLLCIHSDIVSCISIETNIYINIFTIVL